MNLAVKVNLQNCSFSLKLNWCPASKGIVKLLKYPSCGKFYILTVSSRGTVQWSVHVSMLWARTEGSPSGILLEAPASAT